MTTPDGLAAVVARSSTPTTAWTGRWMETYELPQRPTVTAPPVSCSTNSTPQSVLG